MPDTPQLPQALKDRIAQVRAERDAVPFFVLVWGPGSGGVGYEKRIKIRDHLIEKLGAGRVFMSEDAEFRELVEQEGVAGAEGLEAQAFDAVVILDTSIGPHTELLKYYSILLGKALVFVPDAFKSGAGFAAIAYHAHKVEGYSPEQFAACNDIRKTAFDFVQALRCQKAEAARLNRIYGF